MIGCEGRVVGGWGCWIRWGVCEKDFGSFVLIFWWICKKDLVVLFEKMWKGGINVCWVWILFCGFKIGMKRL